ncbi:hypothetical protein MTYM_01006 [Methylococcales bacterium]|nr:hypothetical protein MTYM_01006 [Methylococcales bacterium]
MTTIQNYSDYSILSFASYALNLKSNADNSLELIKAQFTQSQVDQLFAAHWEVVKQSDDSLYGTSGFSATLFKNTQTGEYVFANR